MTPSNDPTRNVLTIALRRTASSASARLKVTRDAAVLTRYRIPKMTPPNVAIARYDKLACNDDNPVNPKTGIRSSSDDRSDRGIVTARPISLRRHLVHHKWLKPAYVSKGKDEDNNEMQPKRPVAMHRPCSNTNGSDGRQNNAQGGAMDPNRNPTSPECINIDDGLSGLHLKSESTAAT